MMKIRLVSGFYSKVPLYAPLHVPPTLWHMVALIFLLHIYTIFLSLQIIFHIFYLLHFQKRVFQFAFYQTCSVAHGGTWWHIVAHGGTHVFTAFLTYHFNLVNHFWHYLSIEI